jgi:hypothetical protein
MISLDCASAIIFSKQNSCLHPGQPLLLLVVVGEEFL